MEEKRDPPEARPGSRVRFHDAGTVHSLWIFSMRIMMRHERDDARDDAEYLEDVAVRATRARDRVDGGPITA